MDGEEKRLSIKEKIAYGSGDFANSITYDCGQLNLLKFYTDALMIPGTIAGSIFLVVKLFDAFTDISVGNFVDGRKNISSRGRFRPFILYGCIPLGIVNVLSFTALDLSITGKIIWAYLTYMAFGLCYSIVNIPYGALQASMTQNVEERTQLASFRQFGASLAFLLTGACMMPIVVSFNDEKIGYIVATTFLSIIAISVHLFCYKNIKENVSIEQKVKEKNYIKKLFKVITNNKPLFIMCVVTLLTISSYGLKMAMLVYYCQYILGDIKLMAILTVVSVGFSLLGIPAVPIISKYVGKVNTFIIGCAIWAFGDFMNYILPTNLYSFMFFAAIAWFGTAFINTLNWAFISDTVEYGEWKTGERTAGIIYSSYAFFRKFAQALAGFIPGVVLSIIGYIPNVQQSLETLNGINILMFVVPGGAMILSIIIMKICYPLTDKKYMVILNELKSIKS